MSSFSKKRKKRKSKHRGEGIENRQIATNKQTNFKKKNDPKQEKDKANQSRTSQPNGNNQTQGREGERENSLRSDPRGRNHNPFVNNSVNCRRRRGSDKSKEEEAAIAHCYKCY